MLSPIVDIRDSSVDLTCHRLFTGPTLTNPEGQQWNITVQAAPSNEPPPV